MLTCSGVKVFTYFIKFINFKILAPEHSNTQTREHYTHIATLLRKHSTTKAKKLLTYSGPIKRAHNQQQIFDVKPSLAQLMITLVMIVVSVTGYLRPAIIDLERFRQLTQ